MAETNAKDDSLDGLLNTWNFLTTDNFFQMTDDRRIAQANSFKIKTG